MTPRIPRGSQFECSCCLKRGITKDFSSVSPCRLALQWQNRYVSEGGDKVRSFEVRVLRPLQLLFAALTILLLLRAVWLWAAASGLAVFYIGTIGARLHPLQTTADLMRGPLNNPSAISEANTLPEAVKRILVSHACTRVAILLTLTFAIVLWRGAGLEWYFVAVAAWPILLLTGALLKLAFKAI